MSNKRNSLPSRFVRRLGSRVVDRHNISLEEEKNIIFSENLLNAVTPSQKEMMNQFLKKTEISEKKFIYQNDFINGTLRIKTPGYYVLKENILFNPINQFPSKEQENEYPVGKNGPFHLGFFAAITIETPDVILDLNGFSITQSPRHSLLQRFFSIIELANSPFIPKQGPHSFIANYKAASSCLIMNGSLINSSHHGIHGNLNKEIVIHNLEIDDFEVAGIALNGSKNVVISDCSLIGKNHDIKVLSSFSQGLFSARALVNLNDTNNDVYYKLDKELQKAFSEIMNKKKQSSFFKNETGQYDGNMYGIVLNVGGVVINDFLTERKETHINDDITIYNVTIDDIETHPVEILSLPLSDEKKMEKINAYGGKQMVGVFGDVFDIEKNMNSEREYIPNVLSEVQLYFAEQHKGHGSVNIQQEIIEWAKSKNKLPSDQIFLPTGDSMGHIMKGNIGLFISGGKNIHVEKVTIDNVRTNGLNVGTSPLLDEKDKYFQGASCYGILMTATDVETVSLKDVNILNIFSEQKKAEVKKIEILN